MQQHLPCGGHCGYCLWIYAISSLFICKKVLSLKEDNIPRKPATAHLCIFETMQQGVSKNNNSMRYNANNNHNTLQI